MIVRTLRPISALLKDASSWKYKTVAATTGRQRYKGDTDHDDQPLHLEVPAQEPRLRQLPDEHPQRRRRDHHRGLRALDLIDLAGLGVTT